MNGKTFMKAVEAMGFRVEHTGGGCTAYARYFESSTPQADQVGGEGEDNHVIAITQDSNATILDEYMDSVGIYIGLYRGEGEAYYCHECLVLGDDFNDCEQAFNRVLDYIQYAENYGRYLCTVPVSGHFFVKGYKDLPDETWSVEVSNPVLAGSDIVELTKYWIQEGMDLRHGQEEILELQVAMNDRKPYAYYKSGGPDYGHHKIIGDIDVHVDRVY